METSLDAWVSWEACADERVARILARLGERAPRARVGTERARCACLPFYADHRLIELRYTSRRGPERVFVLDGPDELQWLDGSSAPMHATNEAESLELTDATVHDYVRFFLYFLRADSAAFVLIESPSELSAGDEPEAQAKLERLRGRVTPLSKGETEDSGRWLLDGSIAYTDTFFVTTIAVASDGVVEMVDDDPVDSLDGISVPEYPSLELVAGGDDPGEPSRDRDVTEAIVAVLLEDAISERDGSAADRDTLLGHFNSETRADKPIDRLTRLVSGSVPVIIIESDVPFVEDFVAGLIDGPDQAVTGGAILRAGAVSGDELRCAVDHERSSAKLHLLSFHAYRGLYDAERTAHELALRDAAVLIGCERSADVPEPLRRIADLVLTFPRIDRQRFTRIFERVFQAKPPPGWDAPGADWTRYLVPSDFHAPRRLNLSPERALAFLRERVNARLAQVTPDIGPRLSELHGLGEARQICEDIVADIHAAQKGQIPWAAVDKGLLLIGAPGTGKTTLARALAKECGIKFIAASAATWQSAGYLDAHLRAMSADFAEARRYAPAILFLDEIDSIGSREQLSGQASAVYQTDVINALLEQIQGINTVDPVIVIAATNYPENVDPALRRAGRLDQVVQLPLPNIAGLEQIFAYYLGETEVAPGVDTRALAELSLGHTGADVEFFVRGAARRARRANRMIEHSDLVAEITRRPRRPDSAPRLGKDELRRVAVHEAGHALARLISTTRGEDVTFITVIPRMDGSLGFVASVPRDGHVLTRRTMLEELETDLAGRAAEEVVFGAADVGAGAGGPSSSSDLAVATRLAALIVCQSGLGDDGALHWTEQATPAQEKQIDALLSKAYSRIVARLDAQRALLDRIVAVLEEKQEMSGDELRELVA